MKTKRFVTLCAAVMLMLFAINTAYAGWMIGYVQKATMLQDGNVIIKFYRYDTTSSINAYVEETADAKAILAVAMTAISMDCDVDAFYNWTTKRFEHLALINPNQ